MIAMSQEFLRQTNTFANVINAGIIFVLLIMLIRSKNQMARVMDKLADALTDQVRAERSNTAGASQRKAR